MFRRNWSKPNCIFLLLYFVFIILFFHSALQAQKDMPENKKYGGTLIIGVDREPRSLDTRYLGGNWRERPGYNQIYDRLVDFGPGGERELIPHLATSWKRIDDVSWLVNLRKGVKFTNGKEITANDVKTRLEWSLQTPKGWKPLRGRAYAEPLKEVEVVDKYTLKMTLKYPNYPLFEAYILLKIIKGVGSPEQVLENPQRFVRNPITSGPFKFVKWVSGDHIIIERNDAYWGTKPYLDRVVFRIIPDDQTRLLALQMGEIDIATVLGLESAKRVEEDPNINLHTIYRVRLAGTIYFNMRRWPMNTLKFRQAVAMGADWNKLTKAAHPYGLGKIRRNYLEGSWAYNNKAEDLVLPYNPKKAKALIEEVEAEAGKKIPPLYTLAMKEEVAANFVRMAEIELENNLGIDIKLNIFPYTIFREKWRGDPRIEWDLLEAGGIGPGIDPNILFQYYKSDSPKAIDGRNDMGYKNPKVDQMIVKAMTITDKNERKKLYQETEKILFQDIPSIPMFNTPILYGVSKRVHDFRPHDTAQIFLVTPWNNIWVEKK